MTDKIKLFEQKQVRTHWDAENEEWYFSVIDIVGVLTDSPNPRKYWSVLKTRLKKEGSELATNCSQLKMQAADGKYYKTDCMTKAWSGLSVKEYKQLKGLKKESLRDNMTNIELVLNMLAEVSTTAISKTREPKTFEENKTVATEGGKIAKTARKNLERQIGQSVISPLNASDKPALEIQSDYELIGE